jgi:molybdate transport system permease protein
VTSIAGPFLLSLELAAWTTVLMLPIGFVLARTLAWRRFPGRSAVEALIALPLVLPPTVLGFYMLVMLSPDSWLGGWLLTLTGQTFSFSFPGLVVASMVFNLPFVVQPMQQSFVAIPTEVREAAWVSGLSGWRTLWRIELPLAWPGVLGSAVLTFAHTLGEFGVVLMVGGNIPGETRTMAIAIYDHVQGFEMEMAGVMSALLLGFAMAAIMIVRALASRHPGA